MSFHPLSVLSNSRLTHALSIRCREGSDFENMAAKIQELVRTRTSFVFWGSAILVSTVTASFFGLAAIYAGLLFAKIVVEGNYYNWNLAATTKAINEEAAGLFMKDKESSAKELLRYLAHSPEATSLITVENNVPPEAFDGLYETIAFYNRVDTFKTLLEKYPPSYEIFTFFQSKCPDLAIATLEKYPNIAKDQDPISNWEFVTDPLLAKTQQKLSLNGATECLERLLEEPKEGSFDHAAALIAGGATLPEDLSSLPDQEPQKLRFLASTIQQENNKPSTETLYKKQPWINFGRNASMVTAFEVDSRSIWESTKNITGPALLALAPFAMVAPTVVPIFGVIFGGAFCLHQYKWSRAKRALDKLALAEFKNNALPAKRIAAYTGVSSRILELLTQHDVNLNKFIHGTNGKTFLEVVADMTSLGTISQLTLQVLKHATPEQKQYYRYIFTQRKEKLRLQNSTASESEKETTLLSEKKAAPLLCDIVLLALKSAN